MHDMKPKRITATGVWNNEYSFMDILMMIKILSDSLMFIKKYSGLSLSRTRKGPANLFEIERVRDRERKIGYNLHKGIETLVRHRERFEIEGVRDRESQVYMQSFIQYLQIL